MKRLKVGITVVGGQQDAQGALWSNGIGQNIVYLALLLQRLPNVELSALVLCPPANADGTHPLGEMFGLPCLQLDDAAAGLDIIIEVGARAELEPMQRFRDRGGKLISYMAGNAMIMNFEALSNQVPHGDYISTRFDACWVTPQHWHTNESYARITRSDITEIAPHIWTPMCLTQSAFRAKVSPYWRAPEKPWSIGVFDPNMNFIKTFHFPLLVVENAFRKKPELIERIMMFSALHLKGNAHFEEFCTSMDLAKAGKIYAEGRFPVAEMLGVNVQAVVAHQWENNLNYLYWDVLYLGWPLIHNSTAFSEAGYYYPEFDPQTGGDVMVDALDSHDACWMERRPKTLETLWQFHIDNPAVQARHVELLEQVMG